MLWMAVNVLRQFQHPQLRTRCRQIVSLFSAHISPVLASFNYKKKSPSPVKPNGYKHSRGKLTAPLWRGRRSRERPERVFLDHIMARDRESQVPRLRVPHLEQPSTCLSHSDTGSAATVASARCWHVFIFGGVGNGARAKCH